MSAGVYEATCEVCGVPLLVNPVETLFNGVELRVYLAEMFAPHTGEKP